MFFKCKILKSSVWILALYGSLTSLSHAILITQFEDALQKVQQAQQENNLWQQRQQIIELQLKESALWQNPSLNISQDGFGANEDQELSIGIRQPLDLFGQRQLKQHIAQLSDKQNQLQQQLWSAQLQLIVTYAWSQVVLSEFEKAVYQAQAQVSQQTVQSTQQRYQAGSIALVDYERSQVEAIENQRLYQQAVLQYERAKRQLAQLWGDHTVDIQVQPHSRLWPIASEENVQHYQQQGWIEKLYALNVIQAQQQIERFKKQAQPNPILNVGINRNKSATEQPEITLAVGVEVPLQLFNRQQYRIPMLQQQQLLEQQQQQRALKQQGLEIENHLLDLKGLYQQFTTSTSQISLAAKVQQRTLQGFQAGKFSITELQQATLQLQNTRLSQLQILKQAWQNALSAEALSLGLRYEQMSSTEAYTQLYQITVEQGQKMIDMGAQ